MDRVGLRRDTSPLMRYSFLLSVLTLLNTPVMVMAQSDYDATIVAYRGLRFPCGDLLTPVLRIKNTGAQVMTGCVVETWKNGLMINSFDWQLAIGAVPDEERQPAFPVVSVMTGDVLEFRIISVNGIADQDPIGNIHSIEVGGSANACGVRTIELEVFTDAEPDETQWVVRNELGQVVAQGGPYTNASTSETHWITLPESSCFGVELSDAGGNGMAGGQLIVRCDGTELINLDGASFSDVAYEGLSSGIELGLKEEQFVPRIVLFPNPAHDRVAVQMGDMHGRVELQLLDASGRVVRMHTITGRSRSFDLDLQGLAPGLHAVLLRCTQGVLTTRLLVQ